MPLCGNLDIQLMPFDPGRLLFGGAEGFEAVADCLDLQGASGAAPVDANSIARLRAFRGSVFTSCNSLRVTVA
jgi:hypothetical protein